VQNIANHIKTEAAAKAPAAKAATVRTLCQDNIFLSLKAKGRSFALKKERKDKFKF